MKRILILFIAATALLATSCRQHAEELINPNTVEYTTPSEQFKAIWHGIDNSYAFWDIDPTNWDSLYRVYLPRFEALDESWKEGIPVPTKTLREYYTDMCGRFVDHHMVITLTNHWKDPSNTGEDKVVKIDPGNIEARQRPYYHDSFSDLWLVECIQKIGTTDVYYWGYDSKRKKICALACNFDGIAYLKLSGYMLTDAFKASDSLSLGIQDVYMQFHKWCAAKDLKGIIIDNRGNDGGALNDMMYVISPFLQSEMLLGHIRHKEGLGRYDYTPWLPYTVQNGDILYHLLKRDYPSLDIDSIGDISVPVVALADINSISMGELTTQAIAQMPNGCFIGERTYGGHGQLFGDFKIDYAGTFSITDAYKVYTPNAVLRDADGKITEGIGYTPRYEVLYDEAQMRAGTDVQLNAALNYIRKGTIE